MKWNFKLGLKVSVSTLTLTLSFYRSVQLILHEKANDHHDFTIILQGSTTFSIQYAGFEILLRFACQSEIRHSILEIIAIAFEQRLYATFSDSLTKRGA